MKPRIILLFIGFMCLWGLVLARAAFLQFLPHERLEARKNKQYETSINLSSLRGAIVDRNGKELAVSVISYSLFADPALISEDHTVAKRLSRKLGLSVGELRKRLAKKSNRFTWIKRHLTKADKEEIDSWGYRGLAFVEEAKRIYPNDELLSQTIGFTGRGGRGLEGVELRQDKTLVGQERRVPVRRDARGRPLVNEALLFSELPDGSDIELTIDLELQAVLESELARASDLHKANHAVGIVLDARTSEILAMAASPTYNPNKALVADQLLRRNRVITDSFEPGSTMKTFAVAAALRENVLEPNTEYDCENGRMKVGRRIIRESDSRHKWKSLTVTEILAKSSNIGAAKIAFDLGAERFHQALMDFGFGTETGVNFPGEAKGILHGTPWRRHLLGNISFGHGIAVTPLQIANAYAAIANGGILHKPYLVRSVKNRQTGDEEYSKPQKIRRVLSEEDSEKMRLMLMAATGEGGTGGNARVAGFPVSGKTGTAQKVDPKGRGYLEGEYISSFAGFLPAHDPKFVIYIAVDSPQKDYYGSQVAAPVFQAVASFAVRKAGLRPILLSQSKVLSVPAQELELITSEFKKSSLGELLKKAKHQEDFTRVPDLKGLTLREVMQQLRGQELDIKVHGQGQVTKTSPKAGSHLGKNQPLRIFLE